MKNKKRPIIVTIICIISFIGALQVIPLAISERAQQIGIWYPPYLLLTGLIGLICMIGLWKMKKWAGYLYIIVVIVNQIFALSIGLWNVMTLLFPGIVAIILLFQLKKMD